MVNQRRIFQISKPVLEWLYQSNSTTSIGIMFGFNAETVRKKLKSFDIAVSRQPATPRPSKEVLLKLYPANTLLEISKIFHVGETTVHTWFTHYGIERTKKIRKVRTQVHRARISVAQRGRIYKERRNGKYKNCLICGQNFYVSPPRLRQAESHYCSAKCKGKSIRLDAYSKNCPQCDGLFERRYGETAGNYHRRIYCSQECATRAAPPPTFFGSEHPNYKGDDARRKQPRGQQGTWRKRVLGRDKVTCQHCGDNNSPMVAHHILSWEDFPELRNELANGITLCNPCHFREHGWSISQAGIQKLIDDRGIEQRRWVGSCLWCDSFLVKQASDLRRADGTYRTYGFCNKECAMQASGSIRKGMTKADIKGLKVSDIFEQWAEDKINNGTSFKQKK